MLAMDSIIMKQLEQVLNTVRVNRSAVSSLNTSDSERALEAAERSYFGLEDFLRTCQTRLNASNDNVSSTVNTAPMFSAEFVAL